MKYTRIAYTCSHNYIHHTCMPSRSTEQNTYVVRGTTAVEKQQRSNIERHCGNAISISFRWFGLVCTTHDHNGMYNNDAVKRRVCLCLCCRVLWCVSRAKNLCPWMMLRAHSFICILRWWKGECQYTAKATNQPASQPASLLVSQCSVINDRSAYEYVSIRSIGRMEVNQQELLQNEWRNKKKTKKRNKC